MNPVYHPKCNSRNLESILTFPNVKEHIDPTLRKERESNVLYKCRNCGEIFPIVIDQEGYWTLLKMEDVTFEDNNTK
tara:strand:+ start:773 stop:1003 length:231 start_codon:yes stop_codon:yes gene_type:complete